MPEHTVTDYRNKNKYGHKSKTSCKDRKIRSYSPRPRKVGNTLAIRSRKVPCAYCIPSLSRRLYQKRTIQQIIEKEGDINEIIMAEHMYPFEKDFPFG